MTLHFQLGKYSKIKFLNFKLFLGPTADSHRIHQKKKTQHHTHTYQDYCFLSMRDGA